MPRQRFILSLVAVASVLASTLTATTTIAAQSSSVPYGVIDRVDLTGSETAIVHGWAIDPDGTSPTPIHVYVDGRLAGAAATAHARPDVAAVFASPTVELGYRVEIDGLSPARHEVCAWAINLPDAVDNRRLGCTIVDTRGRPAFGVIDAAAASGPGQVTVSGWVLDPDTDHPSAVHLYVDGRLSDATLANRPRPDVAAFFGTPTDGHGFVHTLDGISYGTHQVCAFAINQPRPVDNTPLGCVRLNVDAAPSTPRGSLVINGTGDVRAEPHWYGPPGAPDYSRVLAGLDGLFLDDDLTVINLECAGSRLGQPVPKNFNFRCDPDSFAWFRQAGVDVTSQANNHGLDFGAEAMLDASDRLWASGLAEVGSGTSQADALEPALFERNGWRVAVLGLAGFVEFGWQIAGATTPGLANGYDIATMTDAVRRADAVADIVVVAIHWGREGVTVNNQYQTVRGRALVDAGADIVFGHHPHRIQPVERYRDGVIFYSLGNFQWPRLSVASADTAVGQVIIAPDSTLTACLLDATIVAHGVTTLDDPTRRSC